MRKILLDECVPWPLHRLFPGSECTTAQKRGWGGIKNGDLLRLAEAEFDVLSLPTRICVTSRTWLDGRLRFSNYPPMT
jgi:hypothetical protein